MELIENGELETIVIGTLIVSGRTFRKYEPLLQDTFFFDLDSKKIFNTLKELYQDDLEISHRVLSERSGVDLSTIDLLKSFTDVHGFSTHLDKFRKRWQNRTLEAALDATKGELGFQEPRDLISKFNNLAEVVFSIDNLRTYHSSEAVRSTVDSIYRAMKNDGKLSGIDTGFPELNKICGGWQPTDLNIIAARPGMGKTTLMLKHARVACKERPVLIISIEMSADQILKKIAAADTGITVQQMRTGALKEGDIKKIEMSLENETSHPLFIIDDTLHYEEILNRISYMNSRYDIGLVIIDYLQLMSSNHNNIKKHEEVAIMTKGLKHIAKKHKSNLCIIALSQLNRGLESRTDKRPMNSDLAESGAIENNADMIMMIYRESYYYPDQSCDYTEVNITKHRHGELGLVKVKYDKEDMVPYTETDFIDSFTENDFTPINNLIDDRISAKRDGLDDVPF